MFTQTYQCRVTLEKSGHLSWSQGVLYFDNSLTSRMSWSVETTNYLLSLLFFVLPSRSHGKNEKNDGGHLVF